MRVLVVGASGLIGSAIAARLVGLGHEVVAITRRGGAATARSAKSIALDVAHAVRPADWEPHLRGMEAVVNCAGVFQDSFRDSTAGVHRDGAIALFRACEEAGVRRVVQLSALGVDRQATTAFSLSKLAGDQALIASRLDWVILRPSVVIGRAAYGGSALIRGLAALPVVPTIPSPGKLQNVHLDDVVDAAVFFLRPEAPVRQVIELVGPREWSFDEVVRLFRKWLRLPPAWSFRLPHWAATAMFRVGDAISMLGWRPPIRSTALREIMRGSVGDASKWIALTGVKSRDLEATLIAEPASVQERWFARLYFLKPLIFLLLPLFWIGTGLISLGPGYAAGLRLMQEAGTGSLAPAAVIAGALADIAVGIGIAVRSLARPALHAALGLSVLYALAGGILLPRLWVDPLGPLLKIVPILALNLVALAILDDR